MNVVFRVDASTVMGTGHLARCLALADALRGRGIQSRFICRRHAGHLLKQVEDREISVVGLAEPKRGKFGDDKDYSSWLGAAQEEDADETMAAIENFNPAWIVVDHYGIDSRWERRVRPQAGRLMAIDDLANRQHACDLLLDQNFLPRSGERYAGLVPADCRLLLGPRFALLGAAYAHYRRARKLEGRSFDRVFVFFGGSDPYNLTGAALEALSSPTLRHLRVDVVVGINNGNRERLKNSASKRAGTAIHDARPHLADLLSEADLAIGAAGTTTWERMCLGVPALVVTAAENQRPGAEALANEGLIQVLGPAGKVTVADFVAAIEKAASGGEDLEGQAVRARLTVDGLGAMRVAEWIDPTRVHQLGLRDAQLEDAGLFFSWSTDPEVRRQSLNTEAISWPSHQQWFRSRVASRRCRMFVMEARTLPVGQIRFDMDDERVRIGFSVESAFRGRGWGRLLVGLGVKRMAQSGRFVFYAEVKKSNPASAAVFEGLGFRRCETRDGGELAAFRFDSSLDTLVDFV